MELVSDILTRSFRESAVRAAESVGTPHERETKPGMPGMDYEEGDTPSSDWCSNTVHSGSSGFFCLSPNCCKRVDGEKPHFDEGTMNTQPQQIKNYLKTAEFRHEMAVACYSRNPTHENCQLLEELTAALEHARQVVSSYLPTNLSQPDSDRDHVQDLVDLIEYIKGLDDETVRKHYNGAPRHEVLNNLGTIKQRVELDILKKQTLSPASDHVPVKIKSDLAQAPKYGVALISPDRFSRVKKHKIPITVRVLVENRYRMAIPAHALEEVQC